jgi:hypothetical protein
MRIHWVNHASFVLESGAVRLLADPWLEGTAFDNGWALLTPTAFPAEELATVTHLWFSHEHPDHFSPPSLKKIPVESRSRITVLYQRTRDRKVVEYCQRQGFKDVLELAPGAPLTLGSDVRVRCEPHGVGDSWLLVEAEGRRLLDLNDCVVENAADLARLRQKLPPGPLDVLLTQFSYAAWAGNRDDRPRRQGEAARKLEAIRQQVEVLKPTYVLPFASFVWFCHEENYYLNDSMNRIDVVYRFIAERTAATPIVLYPGDRWEVGSPHDATSALQRYAASYARVLEGAPPLVPTARVDLTTLMAQSRTFAQTFRQRNGPLTTRLLRAAGLLGTIRIYLTDHGKSTVFSLSEGLVEQPVPYDECDIALGSQALAYCFENLWGGATLAVNGRFQLPPRGTYARFRRYATLAALNNQGKGVAGYLPYLLKALRHRLTPS